MCKTSENITLVNSLDSIAYHEEADVTLVANVLHYADNNLKHIRVLTDDTDVFVILSHFVHKHNLHKKSIAIEIKKWHGTVYDFVKAVTSIGNKCKGLLAMHALSGCDTTSFPCGKGKATAWNVLMNNKGMEDTISVFGAEGASEQSIIVSGTKFFLALYGQKRRIPSVLHATKFL